MLHSSSLDDLRYEFHSFWFSLEYVRLFGQSFDVYDDWAAAEDSEREDFHSKMSGTSLHTRDRTLRAPVRNNDVNVLGAVLLCLWDVWPQ